MIVAIGSSARAGPLGDQGWLACWPLVRVKPRTVCLGLRPRRRRCTLRSAPGWFPAVPVDEDPGRRRAGTADAAAFLRSSEPSGKPWREHGPQTRDPLLAIR